MSISLDEKRLLLELVDKRSLDFLIDKQDIFLVLKGNPIPLHYLTNRNLLSISLGEYCFLQLTFKIF